MTPGMDQFNQSLALPGLDMLWAETVGDPNICIAILDGPVDQSHPCFKGAQLTQLENLASGKANLGMASQHGSHIASVIFGQHDSPVQGIAPGCRGLIIPVFSERKDGSISPASQLDLARAITQAVENGAHIINISGGELKSSGEADPFLAKAVRYCADKGVLIVAAVGNDGCECLHVPAAIPSTLAVAAMDTQGAPLQFSNWGTAYQTHGVLAPGQDISGAVPGGGVALKTGTSFATPIVSGVAALLLSIQLKQGSKANPALVREAILKGSTACIPHKDLDCRRFLVGSLNIKGAYAFIKEGIANIQPAMPQAFINFLNSSQNMKEEKQSMTVQETELENANAQEWSGFEPSVHHDPAQADDCPVCKAQVTPSDLSAVEAAVAQTEVANTSSNPAPKELSVEEDVPQPQVAENEAGISPASATPQVNETSNAIRSNSNSEAAGFQITTPTKETEIMEPKPNGIMDAPENQVEVEKSAILPARNTMQVTPSEVLPSGCGDGPPPALTYALGTLGYDFRTEARRDSFVQAGLDNPDDPNQLLAYLTENPYVATDVLWTLNLEATPIYAILPNGPFAATGYERLREFLKGQIEEGVERISVPGYSTGSVSLLSGQEVPYIVPDLRGMYSWSTKNLVNAILGEAPAGDAELAAYQQKEAGITNFLERVYHELRNLGITSQDRAMNFAATNAFQTARIFEAALKEELMLDKMGVEASPICRPGSDCLDVTLTFFNPKARLEQARKVYRFTVDVSDTIPVTVGAIRAWAVY